MPRRPIEEPLQTPESEPCVLEFGFRSRGEYRAGSLPRPRSLVLLAERMVRCKQLGSK